MLARTVNLSQCEVILLMFVLSSCLALQADKKPTGNDAGIFSDLWSALTQTGKNPTCPGECVHAITSILCDHVMEEVSCGEPFLRCCVPNDMTYNAGTQVETSPPFDMTYGSPNMYSPPSTESYSSSHHSSLTPFSPSSMPSSLSTSLLVNNVNTSSLKPSTASNISPTSSFTRPWYSSTEASSSSPFPNRYKATYSSPKPIESINPHCPGVCVKSLYARYCGNIMSNGICDKVDETCCLQSERDSANFSLALGPNRELSRPSTKLTTLSTTYSTANSFLTSLSTTPSPTSSVSTSSNSNPQSLNSSSTTQSSLFSDSLDKKDKNPSGSLPDQPTCDGTCVSSLFSLLCDEVDSTKVCPNGGSCCIYKEPSTTLAPIPECMGHCIPTFLSGVCTRPSELVLKTSNCMSGTICCHFQDKRPSNVEDQPPSPPLNNGPLHLPGPYHPSYMLSFPPPPPPNIQHFQRPKIPLNHNPIGLRPPPLLTFQSQHPSLQQPQYGPFIPNRKPSKVPLAHPSSSLPDRSPQLQGLDHDNSNSDGGTEAEVLMNSFSDNTANNLFPGGVPYCPGPCLSSIFRLTCFGGNAIYPKFFCAEPGQICCAALKDIEAYEENIKANNGVWKPHPMSSTSLPSMTSSFASINTTASSPTSISNFNGSTGLAPATIPPMEEAGSDESPIVVMPPVKPPPRQATPYSCGVKGTQRRESPRIVGGSDALPGEWCWQVALINSDNQYICGGALIGSQWVLTAAHCITSLVKNGESIYIRVGDHDLSSKIKSKSAQTQQVSTTYIHHNHNGQTLDNDIALLKMQNPVHMNDSICLVCLPARSSSRSPGQRCIVTGYGYRDEAGPIALKVREAEVPIVDDQDCTMKINAVTEKLFILPSSSFCAGGEEGNDACQGDGGGPLVCQVDGFYELTGLVSWGFGCGRQDVPGVYVKVSNFIGWINQIINVNSQ